MKVNRPGISILLLFIISLVSWGCNSGTKGDGDIVAEINGRQKIDFRELNKFYDDYMYDKRFPEDKLKGYKEALKQLIRNKRMEIDFVETGMYKDSSLIKKMQRSINEEIVSDYFKKEYLSQYINDEAIRNYYDNMSRKVEYKQIVLDKPRNASAWEADSLRNEVMQIKQKLNNGASFDEMVARYSNGDDDGSMPPITWKNSVSSPVIQTIYNMNKGGIRALGTSRAYYIVKVENVSKVDVPPLEQVRDQVRENLRNLYLDKSLKEFSRDKDKTVPKDSVEWNPAAMAKLIKWARQDGFYDGIYKDTLQQAIDRGDNFTILTYPGGKLDLKYYLHLLNDVLVPGKDSDLAEDEYKRYILEALRTDNIIKKAKKMGLDNQVLTKEDLSEPMRARYRNIYAQEHIMSKIPEPTDQALHKFYEQEKDSSLYQLAKVNLYAKIFDDKAAAKEMMSKIQDGQSFKEAANRHYKVKTFIRNREGRIENFSGEGTPYLGNEAFALDEAEVDGPVTFSDDIGEHYAVVKNVRKLKEKQLDYAEVEDIKDKFEDYHRERIQRDVRKKLAKKYPATIHEDILENKVAALEDQ